MQLKRSVNAVVPPLPWAAITLSSDEAEGRGQAAGMKDGSEPPHSTNVACDKFNSEMLVFALCDLLNGDFGCVSTPPPLALTLKCPWRKRVKGLNRDSS